MKVKKRKILIILAILSLLSLVYIFIITNKKTEEESLLPSYPKIVQQYTGKYDTVFSITKDQFDFPDKLPLLELVYSENKITETSSKLIASKMGFVVEPLILDDAVDGLCYFWKNTRATLFIFPETNKIRYGTGVFSIGQNKQLSDVEILSTVSSFLIDNGILEKDSFETGKIRYLKQIVNGEGFEESDRTNSTLFDVSILPTSTEYEFISVLSVQPQSFVQIKTDGSIYSFQIVMPAQIEKGQIEYEIKNYDEVKSNINNATLIELGGDSLLLSEVSSSLIKSVEINEIEIAYLIESNSTTLQPVFKLRGKATLSTKTDKYPVTLYLPAFKNTSY